MTNNLLRRLAPAIVLVVLTDAAITALLAWIF